MKTIDLQPILENELVHIRPLAQSDLESLYEVANDPKIWEQHPYKRYKIDEFEKFFSESMKSKGALVIIDVQTNKVIGSSRFKPTNGFANGIEIGWTFLSRSYWGGAYNKSVKQLMVKYAFNYVDYIVLYIDKDNLRSQEATKKIGGRAIDAITFPGILDKGSNHLTFLITKEGL